MEKTSFPYPFRTIVLSELLSLEEDDVKRINESLDTAIDEKHANLLITRPWWNALHTKINKAIQGSFPQTHLVAHPDDAMEATLLHMGLFSGKKGKALSSVILRILNSQSGSNVKNYIFRKMKTGKCHENCFRILINKNFAPLGIVHIESGYALSADGLWRHHSWGLDYKGRIIETTELRVAYLRAHAITLEKAPEYLALYGKKVEDYLSENKGKK